MTAQPSRRHSPCDGTESPLTRENAVWDGCDTPPATRHTRPKTARKRPHSTEPPCPSHPAPVREARPADDAATINPVVAGQRSNQTDDHDITVHLPDDLPVLNERASRILLAILVRLTRVEVLDGPMEGDGRDW